MQFTLENLTESLATSADPAFAVDSKGTIIAWNQAAETALGHPRGQALGKSCHKLIRGKDVLGNLVCQGECLVRHNIRERKPAQRFRMHVRVSAGHHVETECITLCLQDSEKEMALLHLLRLWPDNIHGMSGRYCSEVPALHRPLSSLTPRQKEVLELLAAGKSTREMAEILFLSPGTVRTHVENILHKLEAHSRLEAVIAASREDLI